MKINIESIKSESVDWVEYRLNWEEEKQRCDYGLEVVALMLGHMFVFVTILLMYRVARMCLHYFLLLIILKTLAMGGRKYLPIL